MMAQRIAQYVDIATSPISNRIRSVNKLVAAGYEVHFNFSPIIIYQGEGDADQWRQDWEELWREIDDTLTDQAKRQPQCEVFFLTHSEALHKTNPLEEQLLWSPEIQRPIVFQK